LRNILDQRSLQWVFVGGKGGVGKTTTSCSLAVQLAKVRRNVLVVSTDPAHNLSDAFAQKFSKEPTLVTGYNNLYCMEVDSAPSAGDLDLTEASAATGIDLSALEGGVGSIMNDLIKSVPGIDEAMAFGELMKMVPNLRIYMTLSGLMYNCNMLRDTRCKK
jgi:arsenite-transporting ATPase